MVKQKRILRHRRWCYSQSSTTDRVQAIIVDRHVVTTVDHTMPGPTMLDLIMAGPHMDTVPAFMGHVTATVIVTTGGPIGASRSYSAAWQEFSGGCRVSC